MANWVAELSLDDVPDAVLKRAKHLLLDGLGCALIGAQLPWSRTATDAVLAIDGRGDTVVIGTGHTASPPAAAVLNGTFVQGFELDDFHPIAPVHSCSLVIPALAVDSVVAADRQWRRRAAGRDRGVRGRATRRLHAARRRNAQPRLAFRIGVRHPLRGDGVGQARWASLPAQLEDALGLAATQSAGLMAAQYEAMSKRMHHGLAARNGFYAAGLASHGYTGIKRVFEREYGGFLSVFGEGHHPDAALLTGRARRAVGDLHDHGEVLRGDGGTARRDRRRPPVTVVC